MYSVRDEVKKMGTNIICGILLVVILFLAIKNSIPHFKGEGACCGGGGYKEKARKPKKLQDVVATKEIYIEGMKCDNCRIRVQNALNEMDDVSAKVDLKTKRAIVSLGRETNDEELTRTISRMGYEVVSVTDIS